MHHPTHDRMTTPMLGEAPRNGEVSPSNAVWVALSNESRGVPPILPPVGVKNIQPSVGAAV